MSKKSCNNASDTRYRGEKRRSDDLSGIDSKTCEEPSVPVIPQGDCYKIYIRYGNKFDKNTLIKLLHSSIRPHVFVPMMYKKFVNDVLFYIDDFEVAKKLSSLVSEMTTTEGFKITIKVTQQSPLSRLNDNTKNRIKLAVNKKYVAAKNTLDLSAFHRNCELVSEYYFPLNCHNVLTEVFDIVGADLPSLTVLNLDKNNLTSIKELSIIESKLPKLKVLHIGHNHVSSLDQFEAIKSLELEELKLTGNPVCLSYKNRHEDYVSHLRRIFPNLTILDGVNLPASKVLEKSDEKIQFPETKTGFAASLDSYTIAMPFLKKYFQYFDYETRQPLLNAYSESASFSIVIVPAPSQMYRFSRYLQHDRNMLRKKDPVKRRTLLRQGKTSIIDYLSLLPQTKHCPHSFTFDITLNTDNMIIMSTTGLFQEINTKDKYTRFFSRTFIIIRQGAEWFITNDQLTLALPTPKQEKNIFKPPPSVVQATQLQVSKISSTTTTITTASAVEPSVELKRQMIISLSAASNMNLKWSKKCLTEKNWNYDDALRAFQEFFKRHEIPQEAFNK